MVAIEKHFMTAKLGSWRTHGFPPPDGKFLLVVTPKLFHTPTDTTTFWVWEKMMEPRLEERKGCFREFGHVGGIFWVFCVPEFQ